MKNHRRRNNKYLGYVLDAKLFSPMAGCLLSLHGLGLFFLGSWQDCVRWKIYIAKLPALVHSPTPLLLCGHFDSLCKKSK